MKERWQSVSRWKVREEPQQGWLSCLYQREKRSICWRMLYLCSSLGGVSVKSEQLSTIIKCGSIHAFYLSNEDLEDII